MYCTWGHDILYREPNPSVHTSAAGCIQNISRDDNARVVMKECGAVPALTDLLFSEQVNVQVCAAGALLNVCPLHSYHTHCATDTWV